MLKYIILIIVLIQAFLFYCLGYNNAKEQSEKELGEFWGKYYNIDSQGNYWELKAKKEGLK